MLRSISHRKLCYTNTIPKNHDNALKQMGFARTFVHGYWSNNSVSINDVRIKRWDEKLIRAKTHHIKNLVEGHINRRKLAEIRGLSLSGMCKESSWLWKHVPSLRLCLLVN